MFITLNKKKIIKLVGILSILIAVIIGVDSTNEMIQEVVNSNRILPIYSVETDKKQVALTFDCAWGASDISQIIETLTKNNVKATFFTVGDWVKNYPEAVKSLKDAGMIIR